MLALAWLFSSAANFFFGVFIISLIILIIISNDFTLNGKSGRREIAVLAGDEKECEELAARVKYADRLEIVETPEAAFEQVLRRKMVLIFVVKKQISGFTEQIIMHLQRACDKLEESSDLSSLKYAIFGIGDTALEEFNSLALSLDLTLRKLGARSETPMHLFDVVTSEFGIDDEFERFLEKISPESVIRGASPTAPIIPPVKEETGSCELRQRPQAETKEEETKPEEDEVEDKKCYSRELTPNLTDSSQNDDKSEGEWEIMDASEPIS